MAARLRATEQVWQGLTCSPFGVSNSQGHARHLDHACRQRILSHHAVTSTVFTRTVLGLLTLLEEKSNQ